MQRRNNASITTILKTVYCVGVSIELVRGNLDRLENLLHVYARTVCGTSVRHLFTFNHIISTYWISARRHSSFASYHSYHVHATLICSSSILQWNVLPCRRSQIESATKSKRLKIDKTKSQSNEVRLCQIISILSSDV